MTADTLQVALEIDLEPNVIGINYITWLAYPGEVRRLENDNNIKCWLKSK